MPAPVTVVVVTYNSRAVVGGNLTSLRDAHGAEIEQCIVVDNASQDGTADLVRREHPWCTTIDAGGNLGFGRGCNMGIERTETPYVLFLNPDAVLPRADLARLVDFVESHPRAGIVAPALREPGASLQHCGGVPTPARILLDAMGYPKAYPDRRLIEPGVPPFLTTWLCGAALLMRMEMLEEIGPFDPRYFMYFEETDLCRRATAAGWEIWAVAPAVATHQNAASAKTTGATMYTDCIAEHFFESRYRYLVQYHGRVAAVVTELAELVLLSLRAVVSRLRGRDASYWRVRLASPILGRRRGGAA